MTAEPTSDTPPPRPAPKVVVPLRMSEAGKAATIKRATDDGFDAYTEWMRLTLQAEINNPVHRVKPTPKPPKKKEQ